MSVAQCTPTYPARVNQILMRAVVEAAAFLELAADDVVDPDIAVKELESMAYLLGQLNESEKRELVAFTEAEAGRTVSADYTGVPSAVSGGDGPLRSKARSVEAGSLWR